MVSPDPVKDGLNWYQYCGNNPATYVDLSGLWAQKPVASAYQQYSGSGKFVGYLAYGAQSITQDPNEGFFMLYDGPTLSGVGIQYMFGDLYDQYSRDSYGALQGFTPNHGPNKFANHTYGGQIDNYDNEVGTLLYKEMERYGVAIGPTLQNPNWIADAEGGKKIKPEDMIYGTALDVTIELEGKTYYIPAVVIDVKGHTYEEGIFQTYRSCETTIKPKEYDNPGFKEGNIVEWYTTQKSYGEDLKNKSNGLKNFNEIGSIIIYNNEKFNW